MDAIRLAVIRNRKLLIVKKKNDWLLPGGKPKNESDIGCLVREIGEELSGSRAIVGKHYKDFTGRVEHKPNPWTERVYFGEILGAVKPSQEISDALFDCAFDKYNMSEVTKKIIESLKGDNYI